MAGIGSEESPTGRPSEGVSAMQRSPSVDALAEWRSSEQVENGIPSTVPSYWESDDDEGVKPCELYGKHTWRIEKFSQINKRELRSNVFEVGGYSWYILIYPQGCDVCNHLSLFLCVANHDKLLPGWSHFAQFTIAVVNKDPKKSKYSDTLHRFWKKEHDWGWKKFMELSKLFDGFIDGDTLTIKAQVQVIREKADRPFRCLDCQYRRELVRVYLTNVEQLCRRFVEEKRGKLGKLIEDKAKWSSFRAFWLAIDQDMRHAMSRERTDLILKIIVKHFFIEKEVTSTLVMDSLYSGLKLLEGQSSMCSKGKLKLLDTEELAASFVYIDKDMFVLVDDILLLLERAAMQPLPPKEEKAPQNRTKDGGSGDDVNKDSVERDERRLTELGRRTVETFVLTHIFSNKIEVAYQEAVALKRQEELIREEEEAWLAECGQKAKRGAPEKKSKKKQAKKKGNNRKGRGRVERDLPIVVDLPEEKATLGPEISDDVSDVSDTVYCMAEPLQLDCERDILPSSSQLGIPEKRSLSAMDDSSSTCSTDSAPSVLTNGAPEAKRKVSKSPGFTVSEPEKRTPARNTSRRVNSSEQPKCENKPILPFTPKASSSLPFRASPTPHEPKPETRKAPLSRPSSAPIIPAPMPTAIPTVQTAPSLTRSTSTSARSYRNAIMGTIPTFMTHPSDVDNRKKLDPCLEQPGSSTTIQNGITKVPSAVIDHHLPADSPAGTSGRQIEACPVDEFPHLDIINDLLDDDQVPDIFTSKQAPGRSPNGAYLNRLFSGLSMGPADGLTHGYGLFEFPKQVGVFTYPNRQVDGLVGGGWIPGPNPFGIRSLEGDDVPENLPSYANGYSVFRPSNGR